MTSPVLGGDFEVDTYPRYPVKICGVDHGTCARIEREGLTVVFYDVHLPAPADQVARYMIEVDIFRGQLRLFTADGSTEIGRQQILLA